MRAFLPTAGAILALAMPAVLTPVVAQTAPEVAQAATPNIIASPDPADIRVLHWIGAPVKNSADALIGNVNDLVFSSAGQIKAVVVGVGGLIGIAEKNVAIEFDDVELRSQGDGLRIVIINTTLEALQAAPEFKAAGEITAHDRLNEASEAVKSGYATVKEKAIEGYNRAKEAMGANGEKQSAPTE